MEIKLKDNTKFEVESNTTSTSIHIANSSFDDVKKAFTDENLSSFEFIENDEVVGKYESYKFLSVTEDESNEIFVAIRKKSEVELRLDALETTQKMQDDAIAEMSDVVYE